MSQSKHGTQNSLLGSNTLDDKQFGMILKALRVGLISMYDLLSRDVVWLSQNHVVYVEKNENHITHLAY